MFHDTLNCDPFSRIERWGQGNWWSKRSITLASRATNVWPELFACVQSEQTNSRKGQKRSLHASFVPERSKCFCRSLAARYIVRVPLGEGKVFPTPMFIPQITTSYSSRSTDLTSGKEKEKVELVYLDPTWCWPRLGRARESHWYDTEAFVLFFYWRIDQPMSSNPRETWKPRGRN